MAETMKDMHLEKGAAYENGIIVNYKDSNSEYKGLTENIGLIDLSYRGKLLIKGKDRFNYLQGLITNDIMNCPVGEGVYATLLNVKGKILYDMTLYKLEEALILETDPTVVENLKEHLLKMKFMSDIEIENITESYSEFSIQGPMFDSVIKEVFDCDVSSFKNFQFIETKCDNEDVLIAKNIRSLEGGVDIFIKNASSLNLWNKLEEIVLKKNGTLFGESVLEITRVEAGIPKYGIELTDEYNPLEVGLEERAVHFNKGCYTGQEAVARMKYRGHSNWFFKGLEIEIDKTEDLDSSIIIDNKEVVKISSKVYSPEFKKVLALAVIRKEYQEDGAELNVIYKDKAVKAIVRDLPFKK